MTDVLEVYSDTFLSTTTAWGVNITFGLRDMHPAPGQMTPPTDKVHLRMSLEHTKAFAMMLVKQLKTHEHTQRTPIFLPNEIYQQMGIAPEDW